MVEGVRIQNNFRGDVKGVRIQNNFRGDVKGNKVFEWGIHYAREKGMSILQLTSVKQIPEAIRFYEGLGFKSTHEGFK